MLSRRDCLSEETRQCRLAHVVAEARHQRVSRRLARPEVWIVAERCQYNDGTAHAAIAAPGGVRTFPYPVARHQLNKKVTRHMNCVILNCVQFKKETNLCTES